MVEKISPNTWRVGFRTSAAEGRKWIRRTVTLPEGLSEEEQRARADLEDARLRLDYAEGRYVPPSPITVRQFADRWISQHVRPNCEPNTLKNYTFFLNSRILPALGDTPLQALTPTLLTQFFNSLRLERARTTSVPADQRKRVSDRRKPAAPARQLSPRTVQHYYDCLNYMLGKAVLWEYLPRNPMDRVQRPKARKKPLHVLDDESAVRLLRCLAREESLPFRCAVLLALLCGLRLGEVGALRLSDVDWARCTISVSTALKYTPETGAYYGEPKSDAGIRVIALPAGMMALLDQTRQYHLDARRILGDRFHENGLIVCRWDGTPYNKDTPSKQFKAFREKYGFYGVRFHDLRHSHATILLANNMDAVAVASRLGHSSADTTLRIYAHAIQRRDFESAATMQSLLDRAFAPVPDPATAAPAAPPATQFPAPQIPAPVYVRPATAPAAPPAPAPSVPQAGSEAPAPAADPQPDLASIFFPQDHRRG